MLKKEKSQKGFTLLEAIVSVAMLASVSAVILNIFVISNRVNVKAREVDCANTSAMSAIEMFKSQTDPVGYAERQLSGGAEVSEAGGGWNIMQYYDGEWNISPERALFTLALEARPADGPGLYSICARVVKESDGVEPDSELVNLSAVKYFAERAVTGSE